MPKKYPSLHMVNNFADPFDPMDAPINHLCARHQIKSLGQRFQCFPRDEYPLVPMDHLRRSIVASFVIGDLPGNVHSNWIARRV